MSPARLAGTIVGMNRNDIDDTVRDMWVTRPRRLSGDKKIAGVAAAVARRYRIDPTLVRVVFVVATFYGGAGILLYLLGWLLLPADDDEVSPAEALLGRGRSSMSTTLTVVLAIALLPATMGWGSGMPEGLLGLAAIGAGLFLLHRHRGQLDPAGTPMAAATGAPAGAGMPGTGPADPTVPIGPPVAYPATAHATTHAPTPPTWTGRPRPVDAVPGSPAAPFGPGPAAGPYRPTDRVPGEPPTSPQRPPAWDPLGVAPFAWDLPEPAQQPPVAPAPKRRSAVTPATIGLALVTAGVCAAVASSDSYLNGPRVVALVLAVIGLGLVVGSFVRGGRGLIAIAIPLAAITWGLTAMPDVDMASMGNREYSPTQVADVQTRYEHGAGNLELDLNRLQLSGADHVTTRVELGLGNITVIVPPDADVTATCSTEIGNVDCLGVNAQGAGAHQTVTDFGDDGERGGGSIDLQLINNGGGNVELKRGH